ncbi:MAG: hypothetical protein ACQESG_02065 [Nanobdellota archaeon]
MVSYNYVKDISEARKRYDKGKEILKQSIWNIRGEKIEVRQDNRILVECWLENKEEYLQKKDGYDNVAKVRHSQTLYAQLQYLKNVLLWFNDKHLKDLTSLDIENLFKGLEQGTIVGIKGKPLSLNSRDDYYKKVFRGGFFQYIGKDTLAKQVIIRKSRKKEHAHFFDHEVFLEVVSHVKLSSHLLAFYLLYDTGLETKALLNLRRKDFECKEDEDLGRYWVVHVPQEISKKSRMDRHITLFMNRTNELITNYLKDLEPTDFLFNFQQRNLQKVLHDIVERHKLFTNYPESKLISLKDFRSSLASYLYKNDFMDVLSIKKRLGHSPSSTTIDKYLSFLAADDKPLLRRKKDLDLKNHEEENNKIKERHRVLQAEVLQMKNTVNELLGVLKKEFVNKNDGNITPDDMKNEKEKIMHILQAEDKILK